MVAVSAKRIGARATLSLTIALGACAATGCGEGKSTPPGVHGGGGQGTDSTGGNGHSNTGGEGSDGLPGGGSPGGAAGDTPTTAPGGLKAFGYTCPDSAVVTGEGYDRGETYYVDADSGNDGSGSGTKGNPWRTLAHAAATVEPHQGHTIVLEAGVHEVSRTIEVRRGINIEGVGRDATKLQYTGSDSDDALFKLWSDNLSQDRIDEMRQPGKEGWLNSFLAAENLNNEDLEPGALEGRQWIRGLSIDGANRKLGVGINIVGRSHVLIEDVGIHDVRASAIFVVGLFGHEDTSDEIRRWPTDIEIANLRATRCSEDINHTGYHQGHSSPCVEYGRLRGLRIHDSYISNIGDDINVNDGLGYGMSSRGGLSGAMIYNNTILVPGNDTAWETDQTIEIKYSRDDTIVCNNLLNQYASFAPGGDRQDGEHSLVFFLNRVVMDPDQKQGKIGVEVTLNDAIFFSNYFENIRRAAFNVLGYDPANNTTFHHNVVHIGEELELEKHAVPIGISLSGRGGTRYGGIRIYNNTFSERLHAGVTLNGPGNGGEIFDVEVRNNLFLGEVGIKASGDASELENISASHNYYFGVEHPLWDRTDGPSLDFEESDSFYETTETGIAASGELPVPYFVPSGSNSPLVDAGTDVGLSHAGQNPDIGALEFEE